MNFKPGDRIRVIKGYEDGAEGTVLFSKPTNGDPHLVLITKAGNRGIPRVGDRLSYTSGSLDHLDNKSDLHLAVDTLLPFV